MCQNVSLFIYIITVEVNVFLKPIEFIIPNLHRINLENRMSSVVVFPKVNRS